MGEKEGSLSWMLKHRLKRVNKLDTLLPLEQFLMAHYQEAGVTKGQRDFLAAKAKTTLKKYVTHRRLIDKILQGDDTSFPILKDLIQISKSEERLRDYLKHFLLKKDDELLLSAVCSEIYKVYDRKGQDIKPFIEELLAKSFPKEDFSLTQEKVRNVFVSVKERGQDNSAKLVGSGVVLNKGGLILTDIAHVNSLIEQEFHLKVMEDGKLKELVKKRFTVAGYHPSLPYTYLQFNLKPTEETIPVKIAKPTMKVIEVISFLKPDDFAKRLVLPSENEMRLSNDEETHALTFYSSHWSFNSQGEFVGASSALLWNEHGASHHLEAGVELLKNKSNKSVLAKTINKHLDYLSANSLGSEDDNPNFLVQTLSYYNPSESVHYWLMRLRNYEMQKNEILAEASLRKVIQYVGKEEKDIRTVAYVLINRKRIKLLRDFINNRLQKSPENQFLLKLQEKYKERDLEVVSPVQEKLGE